MTRVQQALERHLAQPSPGTLRALTDEIIGQPGFRREMPYLRQASHLNRQGRHADAAALLRRHAEVALFSPAFHEELRAALEAVGDGAGAAAQRRLRDASVRAVLDSGNGQPDEPWIVLHAADEYAVARALRLTPVSQKTHPGRHLFDTISCSGGERLSFVVL